MQPYHIQVGAKALAQRNHFLALQPRLHRHRPLPTSSHPTTLQWHTTRQLQPRPSLSHIAKRHRRPQMPMTALVLDLPLCMTSNTATHYRPRLRLSRHQDHIFQDHQHQARDSLDHQACSVQTRQDQCPVHRKVRHRLHHLPLLLHQVNTMAIPHHLQP